MDTLVEIAFTPLLSITSKYFAIISPDFEFSVPAVMLLLLFLLIVEADILILHLLMKEREKLRGIYLG